VLLRGREVSWPSTPDPAGSGPGFRRPYLIISANSFNESRINTVIAAVIASNLRLAVAPGNVRLPTRGTGLTKASVVNVAQVITIDKRFLAERVGKCRLCYWQQSMMVSVWRYRYRSRANSSRAEARKREWFRRENREVEHQGSTSMSCRAYHPRYRLPSRCDTIKAIMTVMMGRMPT
jgi:mRNA interferase MazF